MKRAVRLIVVCMCLTYATTVPAFAVSPPATNSFPGPRPSPQTILPDDSLEPALLVLSMAAASVLIVGFCVASNFRRSLSYDPANEWLDLHYLRLLPNVLHTLADKKFSSPWPRRCYPWSLRSFERRLLRAIRPSLGNRSAEFVEQHLSVWIWIESHRPVLRNFIQSQQRLIALKRLPEIDNQEERDTVLAFLNGLDQNVLKIPPIAANRVRLQFLRRLHIIMGEHGFSACREFELLDQLDLSPSEDIAKVLFSPTIPWRSNL